MKVKVSNISELGQKIKAERSSMKLSLDDFSQKVNVSRQTLARWEKGEGAGPTVFDLLEMCKVFGCDMGYLVGEYDCKTRPATDICQATGLTEKAVNELLEANRCNQWFALKALNEMLTYDVLSLLELIGHYLTTTEPPELTPSGNERKAETLYLVDVQQELTKLRMRVQEEATKEGSN